MVGQILKFTLLFVWYVLLVSCATQPHLETDQETEFLRLVPKSDTNTKIQLKSQKYGPNQEIIIINESNEKIAFTQSFGLKIYSYDDTDQKWLEIKNKVEYMSTNILVLVPKKISAENSFQGVSIKPDLEKKDLPITIRVLVTGNLFENNEMTDEQVSAYTDIRLDENYIP